MKDKQMVAFSFYHPKETYKQVDIILNASQDFSTLEKGKEIARAKRVAIPLASIDDLIKIKKGSNREQDRNDVNALRRVKRLQGNNNDKT